MRSFGFASLTLILALLLACSNTNGELENDAEGEHATTNTHRAYLNEHVNEFVTHGIKLTRHNEQAIALTLKARQIIHRHRISSLVVYEDFDEVAAEDLRIDFYLPEIQTANEKLNLPLDELRYALESLRAPPVDQIADRSIDGTDGVSDAANDVITRVLVNAAHFRLIPRSTPEISLVSQRATISGDFRLVKMDGVVSLTSSRCRITASSGIWSVDHKGVLFPLGYQRAERKELRSAFFTIDGNGNCSRVEPVPKVVYIDKLEEYEAELFKIMYKEAPSYVGLLIGGLRQAQSHFESRAE